MKKNFLFLLIFVFFGISAFPKVGFEAGLGSGFVFYGDDDLKDFVSSLDDSSQLILTFEGSILFPLEDILIFSLGIDSALDFNWGGGNHVNLVDYAFLGGARIYPNLGGLFFSVDYAIGRRTDFISTEIYDGHHSTKWGNGFKFALGYDFSPHLKSSIAPLLSFSIRSMPRGGSRDNILGISLKLIKRK